MVDVFLSYKREDRTSAQGVADAIVSAGWSVWWDTSLVAGDTWNEEIRAQLRAASCVVVLWSAHSWASRWVQAEAHSGFERDVLVAGRLDSVQLEPPFNIVQTADLRKQSWREGLVQLVRGVERKVGVIQRAAPEPHGGTLSKPRDTRPRPVAPPVPSLDPRFIEIFDRFQEARAIVPGKRVKFDLGDRMKIFLDGVAGDISADDGAADTTIKVKLEDFIDMAGGKLDPTAAFMQGKLKVEGDMGVAMQLQSVMAKLR